MARATVSMAEATVAMAAIELAPGASLGHGGRYRLERVLGTGGMASVWLARDVELDRDVAVKVLADVLALDPDYLSRFEREARVAANLSHPHLVRVFDFSGDGRRPYLVMEYLDGGSLADHLRDRQKATWDPEMLARELLDALGYVHRSGVIHRDIKPGNVLIGSDGRARLTDFGIAQPSDASRLTSTGVVIGSKRYIAPEVMRGEPSTERSDLYSLGVLIGQCLTADAAPKLRRLVGILTAEHPERRPASADRALTILDEQPGDTARPPRGWPVPTTPRVSRHGREIRVHVSRPTIALIAVLAALLALILVITSGGGPASSGGGPVQARPNAPLSNQLNQLDRAIDHSRR
ncbi:MAG TPA: serine/threonine-protein kinase [Solirubrobacteraceae bacterium]|nr:serine/threonine-protein kinase [Solirubrobacteraceae bacterium]